MHLTVRMAWHDNNWDGKVCQNPENNTYCVGVHSLLADRIEKKRKIEVEKDNKGKDVKKIKVSNELKQKLELDSYFPPCYWSINTFGEHTFDITHRHAFEWLDKEIPDKVEPHSFFTWPFKLSFVHDERLKKKRHGNYHPDLDKKRIPEFINKFKSNKSIVFFYANYDNPVSADDGKYLLLGCSVLNKKGRTTKFRFAKEELDEIRKPYTKKDGTKNIKMINFPEVNWAIQFTHDPARAIILPYREYIEYTENHPDDDEPLNDMKVIIEEDSLIKSFKYVAMDIDDDKCLYLLYKLRKSVRKIQEHNNLVIKSGLKEEEKKINELISMVWKQRGLYPSLAKVLNHFFQDPDISENISKIIINISSPENELQNIIEDLLKNKIPKELNNFIDELDDIVGNRTFKKYYKSLCKLALINLTTNQIDKIIENKDILEIIYQNPYVLYEEYPADENNLDEPDLVDEPIDLYKIDIGLIPDKKFIKRHRIIQNLREDSPERLRSVIINYLTRITEYGHSYDMDSNVIRDIQENPLLYKNDVFIDEDSIKSLEEDYESHFMEKLFITKPINSVRYYYLNQIRKQELEIKDIVKKLLQRNPKKVFNFKYDNHIRTSINILTKSIPHFDAENFKAEREQLYKNVFNHSFFLLTGSPGTGKTYESAKIIEIIEKKEGLDSITVLAPTGKAALRITENIKKYSNAKAEAKTIDKFIYENKYGWAYDDFEHLQDLEPKEKLHIENLVIDESSMLDLQKIFILFSIIRLDENLPKRIIFIGDENQLPPIGIGKPFYDIINYVLKNDKFLNHNYVHFTTNCRQENDENILKLANAFTDKKRYYEEALDIIHKEGKISDGLSIFKWKDKDELINNINSQFHVLTGLELDGGATESLSNDLNLLFGLYENGYVNNQDYKFKEKLKIDSFQLLTPYRPGYYGTLGINKYFQEHYREKSKGAYNSPFYHSDKIIRINNWYTKDRSKLLLSNGSIGIYNYTKKYKSVTERFYFPDAERPFTYTDETENFDLAYAITVHKAQGSDFRNVFLIIPRKSHLLFRELIYTALTRSKFRLFIFLQEDEVNLLEKARNISNLLFRRTSIFEDPSEKLKKYISKKGIAVRSKVELDICQMLENSGLQFEYEKELELSNRKYNIHPDFTIKIGKQTIFWEHLGMLDVKKYYRDWQRRKDDYVEHNHFDNVVTTDDLNGIDNNIVDKVIQDIRNNNIRTSKGSKFSQHHYKLYGK